jgi:hypothetical protein
MLKLLQQLLQLHCHHLPHYSVQQLQPHCVRSCMALAQTRVQLILATA